MFEILTIFLNYWISTKLGHKLAYDHTKVSRRKFCRKKTVYPYLIINGLCFSSCEHYLQSAVKVFKTLIRFVKHPGFLPDASYNQNILSRGDILIYFPIDNSKSRQNTRFRRHLRIFICLKGFTFCSLYNLLILKSKHFVVINIITQC